MALSQRRAPEHPATTPDGSVTRVDPAVSSAAPDGMRDPDALGTGLIVAPTQPRRGLVLVRVIGEVDMLTAPRLSDVLEGALATVAAESGAATSDREPSVVCDLGGVTFFGASGLDVFATAHRAAVGRDVRLVVVAGHRTVVRPFRLTALDRRITLTDTHPALGRRAAVPGEEGR